MLIGCRLICFDYRWVYRIALHSVEIFILFVEIQRLYRFDVHGRGTLFSHNHGSGIHGYVFQKVILDQTHFHLSMFMRFYTRWWQLNYFLCSPRKFREENPFWLIFLKGVGSTTNQYGQMSRRLSGSFTAGFGTSAEAAAAENGKNLGCKESGLRVKFIAFKSIIIFDQNWYSIYIIYIYITIYHWIWMDFNEKRSIFLGSCSCTGKSRQA